MWCFVVLGVACLLEALRIAINPEECVVPVKQMMRDGKKWK
jgi:hypothetical protein